MTVDQLTEIVNSPVAVAVLVLFFIWLVQKGGWVPGKTHEQAIERERAVAQRERERGDEWKDLFTGGLTIAERAVTKLEKDT